MSHGPGPRGAPTRYELRVLGHLDAHWSNWFTGLTLTQHDDGTTSLCGTVTDQAELHGLLTKIRDLGATLLSVTSESPIGARSAPESKPSATETPREPLDQPHKGEQP